MDPRSPSLAWLIEHAGRLSELIKGAYDGLTAYHRLKGESCPFVEVGVFQRKTDYKVERGWQPGVFLVSVMESTERIVGETEGVGFKLCGSHSFKLSPCQSTMWVLFSSTLPIPCSCDGGWASGVCFFFFFTSMSFASEVEWPALFLHEVFSKRRESRIVASSVPATFQAPSQCLLLFRLFFVGSLRVYRHFSNDTSSQERPINTVENKIWCYQSGETQQCTGTMHTSPCCQRSSFRGIQARQSKLVRGDLVRCCPACDESLLGGKQRGGAPHADQCRGRIENRLSGKIKNERRGSKHQGTNLTKESRTKWNEQMMRNS